MSRATAWTEHIAIFGSLFLCLLLTLIALLLSERLIKWLGETGADVIGRISGVLLAALAVQFVVDGLRLLGPL